MKKITKEERLLLIFIAAVMVVCIIPFVCMTFARTDSTTEKKELAPMPSLIEDGRFNYDYLSELGIYFNDHFAFRQQLVSLDSTIRSRIFGVSTVDNVIVGRDGWLFYKDTLNDFTAAEPMSDRAVFALANNLALTQNYVESRGARFVFTVAPNKNTLYPQFMPYTVTAAERETHNAVRLGRQLASRGINYVDLFALFDNEEDILYLARDSHWNNRGALLAGNALLTAAGRADMVYPDSGGKVTNDYIGDLNSMLYPLNAEPEENIEYGIDSYSYVNPVRSVEDPIIVTSASDVEGGLLMYRDSFGNTLLPFMARAFSSACFVKTIPYDIATYMTIYQPDVVIIEKVERSIDEIAANPPIIETGDTDLLVAGEMTTESTLSICEPMENIMYWRLDGQLDSTCVNINTRVFLRITDDTGVSFSREAFTVADENGDYGFRLYINKEALVSDAISVEVIAQGGGDWYTMCRGDFILSEIPPAFEE